MRMRPCIDIHNGRVKQIVGSSLRDEGEVAQENFVAEESPAAYAELFRRDQLPGGHVILLNREGSPHYEETKAAAEEALAAWPGGLMVGGGVRADNAEAWIHAGASHVIVTSYVFRGGEILMENLEKLVSAVGKEHVVLDLSCRRREDAETQPYYIMTDRWQHYTDTALTVPLMAELSAYCGEFLVHGIAVEGKGAGIDRGLVRILANFTARHAFPVTYAGGIRSVDDIALLKELAGGRVDYTVGSALDLYGGALPYRSLVSGSQF